MESDSPQRAQIAQNNWFHGGVPFRGSVPDGSTLLATCFPIPFIHESFENSRGPIIETKKTLEHPCHVFVGRQLILVRYSTTVLSLTLARAIVLPAISTIESLKIIDGNFLLHRSRYTDDNLEGIRSDFLPEER